MKKNYNFIFKLLIIAASVFFIASCSRPKGTVSFESEKMKKYSQELENSYSLGNTPAATSKAQEVTSAKAQTGTTFHKSNKQATNSAKKITVAKNLQEQKLSPVAKLVAKKVEKQVTKKMEATRSGGLDYNLKMAIIFGAVALILSLFAGIPFFGLLALIFLIVAIVFLVLWLLEL